MIDRFEKKEYYTIDYSDLEKLIEDVYRKPFDFVEDSEASNGSAKAFFIKKRELNTWDLVDIADASNTRVLLIDMCNKGLLPEGNYLVSVSW